MSLAADESEGEQIEFRSLQLQLETTQQLVKVLSQQLSQLKDQVCEFYLFILAKQLKQHNKNYYNNTRNISKFVILSKEKLINMVVISLRSA